jgi:hypothetical protein
VVSGGTKGNNFSGAGIELRDGANNVIDNFGTITSLEGIAVVHSGKGRVTVNNRGGTIEGDLNLASQLGAPAMGEDFLAEHAGSVLNNEGAVLSDLIDLGANGQLVNNGSIAPGGDGRATITRVIGSVAQNGVGDMHIDLDPGSASSSADLKAGKNADLLSASGPVHLTGDILVNTLDLGLQKGQQHIAVVRSDTGVTTSDLSVKSLLNSNIVQYQLVQPTPNELDLFYDVNFASPGVLARTNRNQDRLAMYFQNLYAAGALDNRIANALIDADGASYTTVLNSLGAEIVVDDNIASLQSSLRFGENLRPVIDCPSNTTCPWVRAQATHFNRNATDDNLGFDSNGSELASGFTTVLDKGWRFGGAIAYEDVNLDSNSPASSDGELLHLGVSAGRSEGAVEYSASLAGGYARWDIKRIVLAGGDAKVDSEQKVTSVEGRLGVAYLVNYQDILIKPGIELVAIHQMMNDMDEDGDNAFRLDVSSSDDTYYALQPALEVSTEFEATSGIHVRPHVVLSAIQFLGGTDSSANAVFVSSPGGIARFQTSTDFDDTHYRATLGFDVRTDSGTTVQIQGFMGTSDNSDGRGASVRVLVPL